MTRQQRAITLWAIFGLALLSAIWGWLWMMQHMLEGEAQAARTRVNEAEERALQSLVDRFRKEGPISVDDESLLEEVELASGYYGAENLSEQETLGEWPDLVLDSSEEMNRLHREGKLPEWGILRDGRDWRSSMILRIIRKEGGASGVLSLLRKSIFDFPGSEKRSPGFILLLIKEFEKIAPSPELSELKMALEIEASEGRLEELQELLEVIKHESHSFFYTQGKLLERLGNDEIELLAAPPVDRAFVKISELKVWPYLSFVREAQDPRTAMDFNARFIWWIGAATGLCVIGLISGAVFMAHRELQLARARTDLAASVAHELRTPLAGQRVILESLLKRSDDEQEYLTMALRENERLGDLAEEFLTFSRLERGVLDLQLNRCDLGEILSHVVEGFQEQWEPSELSFTEGEALILANESGVATIARNLIENAWKYSDAPRKIEVTLIPQGFTVRDNGIGLSKKDQEHIFRQFYRVDRKLSRSRDGLGLGLSIVRRLIECMGAQLEVESESGQGSAFTVIFQKGGAA